ncbi:MAG: hypothetical protein ACYCOU_04390 [Sulfobacillus sp.]
MTTPELLGLIRYNPFTSADGFSLLFIGVPIVIAPCDQLLVLMLVQCRDYNEAAVAIWEEMRDGCRRSLQKLCEDSLIGDEVSFKEGDAGPDDNCLYISFKEIDAGPDGIVAAGSWYQEVLEKLGKLSRAEIRQLCEKENRCHEDDVGSQSLPLDTWHPATDSVPSVTAHDFRDKFPLAAKAVADVCPYFTMTWHRQQRRSVVFIKNLSDLGHLLAMYAEVLHPESTALALVFSRTEDLVQNELENRNDFLTAISAEITNVRKAADIWGAEVQSVLICPSGFDMATLATALPEFPVIEGTDSVYRLMCDGTIQVRVDLDRDLVVSLNKEF